MSPRQALQLARKQWGALAWAHYSSKALAAPERAQKRDDMRRLIFARGKVYGNTDLHHIDRDKQLASIDKQIEQARRMAFTCRYEVGGMLQNPGQPARPLKYGAGDTWEEAFADAVRRAPASPDTQPESPHDA